MSTFSSLPPVPPATERTVLSVAEAAVLLGVSRSTVWRWIKSGKLPAYRVGHKTIRIKRADLEMILQPARGEEVRMEREHEQLFAAYDPEKVKEALAKTAGSWADLDTDKLITDLYRAREEGSRPADQPE
jgi:excisionase family DNA binding protein